MIPLIKRHEARLLRNTGHTQPDVRLNTGVSERTLRRIQHEPPPPDLDDAAEHHRRHIGRPNTVEAYRPLLHDLLAKDPQVKSLELLHQARLAGYTGGKTQLYHLAAELRPAKPAKPMVRFEGLAGEFAQHDFGHVDVHYQDGTKERIHFFATRFKHSRWSEVSIVPNEQVETLVRTWVDHYERVGGVPLVPVFDRPKTIALDWRSDGTVTKWHPTFQQVMLELGVNVELCWPYRPQEKGSVENEVGWVKGSFFKVRVFRDQADLLEQLREWLHQINHERPNRATNVIPAQRMHDERSRLRPLRVTSDTLFLRTPVHVRPEGVVVHQGHQYSMPPEAIGLNGTLYLGRDHVRIVAGAWEAQHPRLREPGAWSVLPMHRTAMVKAVKGRKGRLYLKRQYVLQLGPVAEAYLTELVHRKPNAWREDVERLHELQQQVGDARLVEALRAALASGLVGAEYVAHHLDVGVAAMGRGTA
ncbi:MAG: IS21 family transposase [bacterium]